MAATGEQQPPGNQRLAPVQTARALVAAMRKSPALPLPRVLQSPVIGLAGASALQPQRKKRKAENATTGATDGGSTDSPRGRPVSQWVEALPGLRFLSSSAAADAAKQDTDVSTAMARLQQQRATQQEQQQQQQPEVLGIHVEFNEFFLRFLLSRPLLLALYVAAVMDVKQRVAEASFVALTINGWAKSLGAAHLLGVCGVLAGRVSVFLDVINTAGHSATSELMLAEMLGVIEKHDLAGKVCAVVTDTPTPMRKLWRLLEERLPRVLCMGCHAHITNLYFTKIMQLHAFKQHINQAKEVVQYFTHMSLPHELLRQQRAALATSYHLAAATAGAGAGTAPVAGATRSAVGSATVVGAVPAPKVELQQMSQTRFASLYDMLQSV
ncbi:hypothetical protein QJQ45_027962 [Haematococcus lacustris]|nr:hypothetical protein QJQ45_027962 [Haematococcus lacustris]